MCPIRIVLLRVIVFIQMGVFIQKAMWFRAFKELEDFLL